MIRIHGQDYGTAAEIAAALGSDITPGHGPPLGRTLVVPRVHSAGDRLDDVRGESIEDPLDEVRAG